MLGTLIQQGDTCIDATAGNGHDTLALAKKVGPQGKVYAIDIQPAAIRATKERLEASQLLEACHLIQGDHGEELARLLPQLGPKVSAITFNLGYLPGADHTITTQPVSTTAALAASAALLKCGGALLVTAYRGHPGGQTEAEQVERWMQQCIAQGWQIESHEPELRNRQSIPPILWIARKVSP